MIGMQQLVLMLMTIGLTTDIIGLKILMWVEGTRQQITILKFLTYMLPLKAVLGI